MHVINEYVVRGTPMSMCGRGTDKEKWKMLRMQREVGDFLYNWLDSDKGRRLYTSWSQIGTGVDRMAIVIRHIWELEMALLLYVEVYIFRLFPWVIA